MMIRDATHWDIPAIVAMGSRFHREAALHEIAPYDPESTAATLLSLVDGPDGILLIAEDEGPIGMAGGVAYPLYFNSGHKSGQELFWWISPDSRKGAGAKLLDAMEAKARAIGCATWGMICMDSIKPELMGRLYRRRGYRPTEHGFMKRL